MRNLLKQNKKQAIHLLTNLISQSVQETLVVMLEYKEALPY